MDIFTLLPPIAAIIMALWIKDVILALMTALFLSELLLSITAQESILLSFSHSLDRIAAVFSDPGNTKVILFSLLIGVLMIYMRQSGGISALVQWLLNKNIATTQRRASGISFLTGILIFIESNLSMLTVGIISRDLFDKLKLSRARLAFIADSTSAPISILILLNGWGAYILALISQYELDISYTQVLWGSVLFNFYPIFSLLFVIFTVITGKTFGPMRRADTQLNTQMVHSELPPPSKARFVTIPLATLIISVLVMMYINGNGSLIRGDGTTALFYGTVLASIVAFILLFKHRIFTHHQLVKLSFSGMGELLPVVTILLISIALGHSLKALGTGLYIANLAGEHLPVFIIPAVMFITGALISFSTGTSWGTFAILIPLGMPIVQQLGIPPSIILAAILGGGVFGDHCSPISDSTAVASLASGCDLLEHVKTQLPYALVAGTLTLTAYLFIGLTL